MPVTTMHNKVDSFSGKFSHLI